MVILFALIAAISLPPKPDRYVTDRAGVLKNPNALNEKLADFERQTSDQILVYVDQHLPPDTTIEQMGSEAMRQWGVGQKGKDNGAILFVFVADRKMRIEVGYGLEGSLTDAKSKWITSTVIKPQFQGGDYEAASQRVSTQSSRRFTASRMAGAGGPFVRPVHAELLFRCGLGLPLSFSLSGSSFWCSEDEKGSWAEPSHPVLHRLPGRVIVPRRPGRVHRPHHRHRPSTVGEARAAGEDQATVGDQNP